MTVFKTDWLASNTVFYNEKTKKVSHNINDLIDVANFEWDYEGLYNSLQFGHSVFGKTPVKGIKFLPANSSIELTDKNEFLINTDQDPFENGLNVKTNTKEVLDLLQNKIQTWENSVEGDIALPLSGGYDSRILGAMIGDKSRLKAFTFGISQEQELSEEIVYAKEVAKRLNIDWQQIPLGKFHNYMGDWLKMYGPATHTHGMNSMEFYHKISQLPSHPKHLISGLIGDAWSGRVKIKPVESPDDLVNIGYWTGMNADVSKLLKKPKVFEAKEEYFELNKHKFDNENWKIVESMRCKLIILNYLIKVPESHGIKVHTPFLDYDVVTSMLGLPDADKTDRQWQTDYFKSMGIDVWSLNLKLSRQNNLDKIGSEQVPLKPLSKKLLRELVDPNYIDWINNHTLQGRIKRRVRKQLFKLRHTKFIWRYVPQEPLWQGEARHAYMNLYPIQELIKARNATGK